MDMNFTIIIPHKNTPKLLERLVMSIPIREDLEIIIVDDHSDISIVDFNHFPCIERPNTIVVPNGNICGAGFARNYALPLAKGNWILFADSDDFYNSGFNDFLDKYSECDSDVVYFNANSVDNDTFEPSNRADHLHKFIDEYQQDHKRGELIMRYFFTEPWCKLIRRSLIEQHSVRFDDTSIHEDVRFSCLIGHYAHKIVVDDHQLYCVTSRMNSLSRTQTHQAYLDELKVFSWWKKLLLDNNIPLELSKFDYRMYNFSRHLYKNNCLFREEYRTIKGVGFSHVFITKEIVKYLWKSVGYKLLK